MADTVIPNILATTDGSNDLNLNFDDIKLPEMEGNGIPQGGSVIHQEALPEATPPIQVTPVEVLPTEEIVTTPEVVKDDRLTKEDKIVEGNETLQSRVEAIEPKVEEIKINETEEMKSNLPSSSLQEDQKIIDELTETTGNRSTNTTISLDKGRGSEAEEGFITQPIAAPTPTPQTSFNLDSLISEPIIVPKGEVPVTYIQPAAIPVAPIPASNIETSIPTIENLPPIENTIPEINGPKPIQHTGGTKKMISILLLFILGSACAYVLKTMYPLEYENLKTDVMGLVGQNSPEQVEITPNSDTGGIENILTSTGDIVTGEVITGDQSIVDISGGQVADTSGFNAFQDLEGILTGGTTSPAVTQAQTDQLKQFADEGKAFLDLGKKINDKIMIKYGIYVYKKATTLMQSIENKEQIDIEKIDQYINQFSGYLNKLTTLSYESGTQTTVIPETNNSGTQTDNMIEDVNWEDTGSVQSQP